jgi:hypothetical protein
VRPAVVSRPRPVISRTRLLHFPPWLGSIKDGRRCDDEHQPFHHQSATSTSNSHASSQDRQLDDDPGDMSEPICSAVGGVGGGGGHRAGLTFHRGGCGCLRARRLGDRGDARGGGRGGGQGGRKIVVREIHHIACLYVLFFRKPKCILVMYNEERSLSCQYYQGDVCSVPFLTVTLFMTL